MEIVVGRYYSQGTFRFAMKLIYVIDNENMFE